ncbi:alpha/beta fold hydrolase [Usitatibacter palustris]|uniref:Proline iminopeptidase n=1 Tax=Usitatibacter palustris TaxID=2732487 RepID=A0A6M4HAD4_9PROT|nr:alpha/beta fold hydrolase [Usitatibacter palustris]QJR15354.1 Proline iminopeptidase [Usitatibacter palustris]
MRAKVRGTEIYFDVEGAGLVADGATLRDKPVAFAIHGGPGSDHSGLRPGFSPLSDRMQIVYFDHRGSGRSGKGDKSKYTLEENIDDMEALRQHLGVGPIVSMGTSYGGMMAMAHAIKYPQAVSHLVLIVTAAHSGIIERSREIAGVRGTPAQKKWVEDLYAGRIDTSEKLTTFHHEMGPLYAVTFDEAASLKRQALAKYEPEPLNRAFAPGGFMRSFDLRPKLGAIRVPTLILAGRQDWICAPEFSEEIHRLIPGSKLVIFENSSHSMRLDEPEGMRREIAAFVGV